MSINEQLPEPEPTVVIAVPEATDVAIPAPAPIVAPPPQSIVNRQAPNYAPGDVVNGHVLTSSGTWVPLPPEAAAVAPVVVNVNQTNSVRIGSRRTAHFLHFILTLLTAGLWIPIWIWRTIANNRPI